jgi:hypothetical protein
MTTVQCPTCNVSLGVPPELLGKTIRCGKCQGLFEAVATAAQPALPPAPRTLEEREQGDGSRDDWRRWPSMYREDAMRRVLVPAMLLLISGILYLLMGLGAAALAVVGLMSMMEPQPVPAEDDMTGVFLVVLGSATALICFCCAPFVIISSQKLKSLTSPGWARAATILGMGMGIITFLACWPLGIACLALGIWTLVVVNDPSVKRVLKANALGEARLSEDLNTY